MQTKRLMTKAAKRYWKLLLVVAILLQLFLMIRDAMKQSDKETQRIVIFQSAPERNNSFPSSECPKISFDDCPNTIYLQSGLRNRALPIMCLNSVELFGRTSYEVAKDKADSHRGVHTVVLAQQGNEFKVEHKAVYDTYMKDEEFVNFLIHRTKQADIVLLASFDDMSVALSPTARGILSMYFGSQEADTLKMRDYYVMIGQKGLAKGYAFEQLIRKRANEDYPAESAKLAICAKFPLGPVGPLPPESVLRAMNKLAHLGVMFNCGLDNTCEPFYSIPVWISTGFENSVGPELCINSHLVFHPLIRLGGGGYNLAQYDPSTQQIVTRDRFNTVSEGLTRIQIFLEQIPDDHILFGVIHDDGSKRLPNLTRFGITIIEQLQFRSVGFFVAQRHSSKAIQAIGHRQGNAAFPSTITFRGCMPRQIKGVHFSVGGIPDSNIEHRFCGVNGIGYDPVCAEAKSNLIKWVPQNNNGLQQEQQSNTAIPAIFIMAGNDASALYRCLESLANQVFLKAPESGLVTVVASDDAVEFDDLKKYTGVYGYKFETCKSNSECGDYQGLYLYALQIAAANKTSGNFIFIEPDVVLSPDFLAMVSAISLSMSSSVGGISAWNHNGYSHVVSDPMGAFLTETALPSPCVLLSKEYATKVLVPYLSKRQQQHLPTHRYLPWFDDIQASGEKKQYFAVLEVSRCFKVPPRLTTSTTEADYQVLVDLFYEPRRTSLSTAVLPAENFDALVAKTTGTLSKIMSEEAYDSYLVASVSSRSLISNLCQLCRDSSPEEIVDFDNRTMLSIVTTETAAQSSALQDWSQLKHIAECCQLNALVTNTRSKAAQPGFGLYKSTYQIRTKFFDFLWISKQSPIYLAAFRDRRKNNSTTE